MDEGLNMIALLFILIELPALVLVIAALVIAIIALARTFKNAREIRNLKSGRTPDR
jgi:hypothetical protein